MLLKYSQKLSNRKRKVGLEKTWQFKVIQEQKIELYNNKRFSLPLFKMHLNYEK